MVVLHGSRVLRRGTLEWSNPSGRSLRECSAPACSGRRSSITLVEDRVERDRGATGLTVAD